MDDDIRDLFSMFVESCHESLTALDNDLVRVENGDRGRERLESLRRTLHTLKGSCSMFGVTGCSEVAHVLEDLTAEEAEKGEMPAEAMRLCFAGADLLRELIESYSVNSSESEEGLERCHEFCARVNDYRHHLVTKGGATSEQLLAAVSMLSAALDGVREQVGDFADFDEVDSALEGLQKNIQESGEPDTAGTGQNPPEEGEDAPVSDRSGNGINYQGAAHETGGERFVRVPERSIDSFLNHVGGLIEIAEVCKYLQRRLEKGDVAADRMREFQKVTVQLNEHAFALQADLMDVRRVSLSGIFGHLPRLARDVAQTQGKQAQLSLRGGESTIDKSLVDQVEACIVQILRNAVAHGIENPDERRRQGKPEAGQITVEAHNEDRYLVLNISDDGAGLNLQKIRQRALENNLLTAEAAKHASDEELSMLIFASGLSTATGIDMAAGRGVGLDVVAAEVKRLGGHVGVDSTPGEGTSISVRLPLDVTLSVLSGIVAGAGESRFVIPTQAVLENIYPTRETITTVEGKGETLLLRNELLPLYRTASLFNIPGTVVDAWEGVAMVVESHNRKAAILFDALLDIQQVVVKNITGIPVMKGIAGGAILGDGGVGLVIDTDNLLGESHKQAPGRTATDAQRA